MKLGLRRRALLSRTDASALLVWSADAAVWFAELEARRVPAAGVRVGLVAGGRAHRKPVAALLLLPVSASLSPSARAMPCLQRGPGLVHPADAVPFPPLRDAEVKELGGDGVLFLHPSLGCTHFATDELHELTRFVAPMPEGAALDDARPAATLAPRLLSVRAKQDRDPIQSIVAAGKEIGAQPLSRWRGWLSRFLRPREKLDDALLRLLRDDPERGLRHAMPLAGDALRGAAGEAGPGWLRRLFMALFGQSLPTQEPDFALGRLGSSRPRGPGWILASARYHDLERAYRELAAAEARAGRHRRAAYIYAHLLRDLATAAAVLEQGGCWHEAAHLYEHALGDPLHAAACLVKGDELARALLIYRRFDCHVEAGDVLRALGDAVAAEASYARAVEVFRRQGDHLSAAQLLDERLAQPDAALAELALACDGGASEALARRRTFAILTRLRRRDELCASLRATLQTGLDALAADDRGSRARTLAAEDAAALRAQALLDFALACDDPMARELAKDGVRRLVAAAPDLAFAKDARLSAQHLRDLEPNDELHAADLARLAQRRATFQRWRDDFGASARSTEVRPRRVALAHPLVGLLGHAANDAGLLLAASGVAGNTAKLSVHLHWVPLLGTRATTTPAFELNGRCPQLVMAGPLGSTVFHVVERDARERHLVLEAGRPGRPAERPWPRRSLAVARRPDGRTVLLRTDPNDRTAWTLWLCDADLRLQYTRRLPRLVPDSDAVPHLAAAAGWLAVGDGQQLSLLADAGLVLSAVLPWPVAWLAIAPADCAAGRLVLAGSRNQHVLLGARPDGLRVLGHSERRIDAEPAFIAGDRFLLQSSGVLILARWTHQGIAAAPLATGRIRMVCPTPRPGLFAMVDQHGLAWLEVD